MNAVYLDYAATTPVDPAVAEAMGEILTSADGVGNAASAGHAWGRQAARRIETARAQVAAAIGAAARDVIFTSGATEADNLALKGAAQFRRDRGRHIVTAATEHRAVTDVCRELAFQGFDVTFVEPEADGRITPDAVARTLRHDTILVSIMHANNETGVINDIGAIGEQVRAHGAIMHVDAAQTAGKLALDTDRLPIDLLSLSAHKMHGPQGIGALWIRGRPRVRLLPLFHGGGHERGLRAGTLATHQIVGMGVACELAVTRREADGRHADALADRLRDGLAPVPDWHENGAGADRLPWIRNLAFRGVDGVSLVTALGERVALSTGSACTTGSTEPSAVLRAMGQDAATAAGAVRISWGRFTTAADMDHAVGAVSEVVARMRGSDLREATA